MGRRPEPPAWGRTVRTAMACGALAGAWPAGPAGAGDEFSDEPRSGLHRLLHRSASPPAPVAATAPRPKTAAEIAQRIDHVAESIRNDGLVVLKQPDVFSQARMTKYRREFEEIMARQKDAFQLILAGRVARIDAASLDSQTSLSAALAPPGTKVSVAAPTTGQPPVTAALDGTVDGPRFVEATTLGQAGNLSLGLEPNSALDEQKSYLDRLHAIRRVNLGNDVADSAGYGLYLIRMPVSITPGECTLTGHGAEATVTVKHEFPANFLTNTFRNLVINDLVDQLAPPIYEAVRAKIAATEMAEQLKAEAGGLRSQASQPLAEVVATLGRRVANIQSTLRGTLITPPDFKIPRGATTPATGLLPEALPATGPGRAPSGSTPVVAGSSGTAVAPTVVDDIPDRIERFIFRLHVAPADADPDAPPSAAVATDAPPGTVDTDTPTSGEARRVVVRRLQLLVETARGTLDRWLCEPEVRDNPTLLAQYRGNIGILTAFAARLRQPRPVGVRDRAARDEQDREDAVLLLRIVLQDYFYVQPEQKRNDLAVYIERLYSSALPDDVAILNDAFSQTNKDVPVKPARALAEANLKLIRAEEQIASFSRRLRTLRLPADRAAKRSYPIAPSELAAFFLESNLKAIADDIEATRPTQNVRASDVRSYLRQQLSVAYDVMSRPSSRVEAAISPLDDQAALDQILRLIHDRAFTPADCTALGLSLFDYYRRWIAKLPSNLEGRPLGALCWAIAVDAALLDEALREQARVIFQAGGMPCPDLDSLRFYFVQPDLAAQASGVFNDYVAARWPVITFALDPVVDQQNILDNFSLRRDLQLALAFAFSTGKINFNQLTTFRRKIQQDEETVALNKTVTSFAHGNETFGWRFTPRFQTPPSQGNIATLGSTLLRGGPGPNYGLRKSKLEAGQRELVAVVIMPSFLPTIRVESSGNWFRLDDPEHLEVRTRRMLEQGRRVQEIRQEVASACDAACYRPADIRHLKTKVDQVDAMLPIQSKVVTLPFDNAPAGFDLFTEGTTALVPELSGFEGVEAVIQGQEADLLVFGKFVSIHETRVVAGGRELKNGATDTAGYEILSREVIRVHLPADVQPSQTQDKQEFVEIYLATPNGISNRLLVPYRSGTPAERLKQPAPDDPDGTVKTTTTTRSTSEAVRKVFPPRATPAAPTPPGMNVKPNTPTPLVPDPAKLVPGFQATDDFDNAQVGADAPAPTPTPASATVTPAGPSAAADRPGRASLASHRDRQISRPPIAVPPAIEQAESAAPPTPGVAYLPPLLAGLPPLPMPVDPALVRTSIAGPAAATVAKLPAAVVLPTPIVIMPPAAPKAQRRTILGRVLDRLHPDKAADPRR